MSGPPGRAAASAELRSVGPSSAEDEPFGADGEAAPAGREPTRADPVGGELDRQRLELSRWRRRRCVFSTVPAVADDPARAARARRRRSSERCATGDGLVRPGGAAVRRCARITESMPTAQPLLRVGEAHAEERASRRARAAASRSGRRRRSP